MPPMNKSKAPAAAPGRKPTQEHGTKNIQGALDDLDDVWKGSEPKEGFEKVPEGKYQCRIEEVNIGHAKTSGRLQATFTLVVASGQCVNRKLWKRDGLDNEDSLGWFKGGLARLGVEAPASMRDLPATLNELVGTFCEVTVKHKGDDGEFVNVYFNKALDSDSVATDKLEEAPEADGDSNDESASEEESEPRAYKVGDQVQADFDGDWYTGKVTKVKGTKATVSFEDGEVHELEFSELQPFSPDGDDEEGTGEESEEAPAGEEEAEEAQVTLKFAEKSLSTEDQQAIEKLARANDFNPDDYAEWCPLIVDICEFLGISGTFAKPAEVLKQMTAKTPAKKPAPAATAPFKGGKPTKK